jgi:Ankyrin repeat
MKKLYFLSGIIVFGAIASDVKNPGGLTQEQREAIEEAQRGKITRQQELSRPSAYQMIDPFVAGSKFDIDWPTLFSVLDSMKGVINVNEYRTPNSSTLLGCAVIGDNLLAVSRLLEVYRANPNLPADLEKRSPQETPLMLACKRGDSTKDSPLIVKLLLKHGANPNVKDKLGNNSFDYAEDKPEILKILESFKK